MDFKIFLSDEELGFAPLDDLLTSIGEFTNATSKERPGARRTRSSKQKSDALYERMSNFSLPTIKISEEPTIVAPSKLNSINRSTDSCLSVDSDTESSSRPITRSLRSRSRTPQQTKQNPQQQQQQSSGRTTPCTPVNQRLRNTVKPTSGSSSTTSGSGSNYVTSTKLRQALRANSAQKKRQEEKERQQKLLEEGKAKVERAEAQRRQLLQEKAIRTRQYREEREKNAAELRKAREQAARMKKQEEEIKRAQMLADQQHQQQLMQRQAEEEAREKANEKEKEEREQREEKEQRERDKAKAKVEKLQVPAKEPEPQAPQENQNQAQLESSSSPPKPAAMNQTFKMPATVNNIDIVVQDETDDGTIDKAPSQVAAWAKSIQLRTALIEQFSLPFKERLEAVRNVVSPIESLQSIDLQQIFGPRSAFNKRCLVRTSSAVWTPPNRSMKRSSSQVTPTLDK